jgi:hypothetical protein
MSLTASAVLSALTAAISDSGLGLQPVAEIRERATAKTISDLYLIAAFYPFKCLPILSSVYLLSEDNAME